MVADYAAAHPGQPVWGHGWDETSWPENSPPSTGDLDAALGDRPAYLARVDVHSALASTGLRRLVPELPAAAGYSADQPLFGDAHHLVRAVARGLLTAEQLADARAAALRAAAAAGIVAVHECAGPEIGGLDDWLQLRTLDHGVEIIGYWGEAVTTPAQARALMEQTGARGLAGDEGEHPQAVRIGEGLQGRDAAHGLLRAQAAPGGHRGAAARVVDGARRIQRGGAGDAGPRHALSLADRSTTANRCATGCRVTRLPMLTALRPRCTGPVSGKRP